MNINLEDKIITEQKDLRKSIGNVLKIQDILFKAVMQIKSAQEGNDERVEALKDSVLVISDEIAKLKK